MSFEVMIRERAALRATTNAVKRTATVTAAIQMAGICRASTYNPVASTRPAKPRSSARAEERLPMAEPAYIPTIAATVMSPSRRQSIVT